MIGTSVMKELIKEMNCYSAMFHLQFHSKTDVRWLYYYYLPNIFKQMNIIGNCIHCTVLLYRTVQNSTVLFKQMVSVNRGFSKCK